MFQADQNRKKLIFKFLNMSDLWTALLGIGLIIGRYKLMESLGGELVVSHLSPKNGAKIVSLSGVIGKLAENTKRGKQMI
ncbi:MAG: hypothetical protein ACLTE2_09230 [Eubacteriales bacterium]